MTKQEIAAEALHNATTGQALSNYPAIYRGFMERDIAEADIKPRENVFTYRAWQALGRQVRKGEHGVKIVTWVAMTRLDKRPEAMGTEIEETYRRPRTTTVFHVTQTDPIQ